MIEQDFYLDWQRVAEHLMPFEMACRGGEVAVSPGFIFLAGYQAAIRATFPELKTTGWFSFAVTEDRSPESVRPGVVREADTVTGHKTWIAGINCVDEFVLKVGAGEDAVYGTVLAADSGVRLTPRDSDFLSDMSQGSAEFVHARFSELSDASGVKQFRHNEPYYIYIALLARLAVGGPLAESALQVLDAQRQTPDLVALDSAVSTLLTSMVSSGIELGSHWGLDQRLFTMYSNGIQSGG